VRRLLGLARNIAKRRNTIPNKGNSQPLNVGERLVGHSQRSKRGGKSRGAFWSIRQNLIYDSAPNELHCTYEKRVKLASHRTRLNSFSEEEQSQLINLGYANCDLSLRVSILGAMMRLHQLGRVPGIRCILRIAPQPAKRPTAPRTLIVFNGCLSHLLDFQRYCQVNRLKMKYDSSSCIIGRCAPPQPFTAVTVFPPRSSVIASGYTSAFLLASAMLRKC